MHEELLDFEWVISHETKIAIPNAKLFQQAMNTDSILLTCAMLNDNNIPYQIVEAEKDTHTDWNVIFEIHVAEEQHENANTLLELLLNHDPKYPKRRFQNKSIRQLEYYLEEQENGYYEALAIIELRLKDYFEDEGLLKKEISTFEQVYKYNAPKIKADAELFQECSDENELIKHTAMLFDAKIPYYTKRQAATGGLIKNYGSHLVFIKKTDLVKANDLLKMLSEKNKNYPFRKFQDLKDEELIELVSENKDNYKGALATLELKVRGHDIDELLYNKYWLAFLARAFFIILIIAILYGLSKDS